MNKEFSDHKVKGLNNTKMNDYDYIVALLNCEKNMNSSLNNILNDIYNESLYNEIYDIFDITRSIQRSIYETLVDYGWCKIEKDNRKILKVIDELSSKLVELID